MDERQPAGRGQHQQTPFGHLEQLERLPVAGAVHRWRADNHPVEPGVPDQRLRLGFGRAVHRQFGFTRGERRDEDEAAGSAGGRGGEHGERAGGVCCVEPGGIACLEHAGDVDHRVGIGNQRLKGLRVRQRSDHPLQGGAGFLWPACERRDRVAGRDRRVEQP
jgi:hypothetical protein